VKIIVILIAIAGTVVGAAHTYITRNQYIDAALMSEAFSLISPLKMQVADYYLQNGSMPDSNAEANAGAPNTLFGASVKRIEINPGGVLRVDFAESVGASSLVFTPHADERREVLSWHCTSDSIDPVVLEKLRPKCSHLPLTLESQLVNAVANQSIDSVDQLIAAGVNVNAVVNRNSPLMQAVRVGNVDIINRLLERGARVDQIGLSADSPMLAQNDDLRAQRLYTELNRAARNCQSAKVVSILREEGELPADEMVDGRQLSANASNPRCEAVLSAFVKTLPVYQRGLQLHLSNAMRHCYVEDVHTILRDNSNVDVLESGDRGLSYFEEAVHAGCTDLVAELIHEQSLGNRLNGQLLAEVIEKTPENLSFQLVNCLLEAGVDVNATSQAGEVALAAAIAAERPAIAKYLVDAGANVNAQSAMDSYPLIEATKKGYTQLMSKLIAAGAQLDSQDQFGRTAIFAAVAQGKTRLVDVLLRAGANPYLKDNNGISALILAESTGQKAIQTLITSSASMH